MRIEIIAIGCARCRLIEVSTSAALEELGLDNEVEKIRYVEEAKKRGVTAQPALLINGRIMCQGRVPTVDEIKEWIVQAQGKIVDYSVV